MHKFLVGLALVGLIAGTTESCRTSRSTKQIRSVMAKSSNHKDTTGTGDSAKAVVPAHDAHADSLAFIRQTLDALNKNHIDFKGFSAKLKVHYEASDGKEYDLGATVRIRKDSAIWVSITATLGIEAFRVMITPDSVKIFDKIKKTATLRSVSYLQNAAHLPLDFYTLQDLLVGNPIFLDTNRVVYYKTEANNGTSLFSTGSVFRNFLTLNSDGSLLHIKLDDSDILRSRTGDITYGDYERDGNTVFSKYRMITVAEKGKIDIELDYKQHRFNEDLGFSFPLPQNYKRK